MSKRIFKTGIVLLVLFLVGCGGGEEEPLPTLIQLSPTATVIPTTEATLTSTPLPPSDTPIPPIEATVTPADEATEVAAAAPAVDAAACAALVESAYEQTRDACAGISDDEACYGNVSIESLPDTLDFNETGDIAPVADIESLRLSSMNTELQEWGISLMRLVAAESSQSVELLLFGNVQIANAGTSDSGLQAYTFTSGADDRPCEAAPDSGILIQTPQGVGEVTLLINEVVIDLGSTAYLQAQPGADMSVSTLEGAATVTSNGTTVLAPAGTFTRIPIDSSGVAAGVPSDPEPYTEGPLLPLPLLLLQQTVTVAPPALVVPQSATLGPVTGLLPLAGDVSPTRSRVYFFRAEAGQLLYFYTLLTSEGCCMSWQLFGPDGASLFSTGFSDVPDYRDLPIQASGRYQLVMESISEFSGSYEGQIGLSPQPEAFSINLGDTVAPDAPSAGAGRIEAVGAKDIYTFTAAAGQRVYAEPLTDNGVNQLAWSLTDEDGVELFSTLGFEDAFDQEEVLERGGLYTLTVDGQQLFTGEYSFRLGDVPPVQTFDINLDDPLLQGSIDAPGEQDVYTFAAEAGQQIFIESAEGDCCDFYWIITDESGQQLLRTAAVNGSELTLENDGTYTLTIDGIEENTGPYSFRILAVLRSESASITLDDPLLQGSIDAPGEQDVYTFAAEAGQQIFIESAEGDCCDFYWIITDESGQELLRTAAVNGSELTLENDGTYTLTIDGIEENTGPYSFRVLTVLRSESASINLDDPLVQGSIDAPGEQDVYTFAAEAGQQIFIESAEGDCCDFYWIITDESGQELLRTAAVNGSELTLENDGAYTLTIDGIEENTGLYSFRVLTVAPAQTSGLVLDGPLVEGSIDAPGEQDEYTFTAEAGQQIFIDAPVGDCCDFYWIITDEAGGQPLYTAGVDDTVTLLENGGTYTLTIDGIEENTGPYSFQIFAVVPPETFEFALGSVVEGSIETYGTEDIYTFSVEQGQTVFITKMEEDIPSGLLYFSLLDEEGEYVFQDDYLTPGNVESYTLIRGGMYELHVYGYADTLGTYSLRMALDPMGVRPLDGDFVRQWASSATASSQYGEDNWSAMQATGEPNTFQCGDIPSAWASQSSTGMDTLELRYDQALVPERIDIYQTANPGSITMVQLIDTDGEIISLPNTTDPPGNTLCPGVFSFDVHDVPRPVEGIIITLDQTIGGSWNEIDAVELIGSEP